VLLRDRYHLDRVRFLHGFIRALYFLPFLTTATAMAWVWRWFYQPVPIGSSTIFSRASAAAAALPALTEQALPRARPAIWAGSASRCDLHGGVAGDPDHILRRGRAHRRGVELGDPHPHHPAALKPTIVFLVVFSYDIGFLRIFDQVYNMTSNDPGGPLNSPSPWC
jgi:multiple sugar transport system permease protein